MFLELLLFLHDPGKGLSSFVPSIGVCNNIFAGGYVDESNSHTMPFAYVHESFQRKPHSRTVCFFCVCDGAGGSFNASSDDFLLVGDLSSSTKQRDGCSGGDKFEGADGQTLGRDQLQSSLGPSGSRDLYEQVCFPSPRSTGDVSHYRGFDDAD